MDLEDLMKQLQKISDEKNLRINIPDTGPDLKQPTHPPSESVDFDLEHRQDKLLGWESVNLDDLKQGDHIRVTANRYKSSGRSCSHVVIQKIEENDEGERDIYVNSYKQRKYADWKLKPNCPYKQQQYYIRNDTLEHTGLCVKCKKAQVPENIYLCSFCRYNR